MKFEWDETKAASGQQKHGITFEEASTVFDDPLGVIFDDEWHSDEEPREILIGQSRQNRLLLVCFTTRYEAVRLISARPATKQERQDYEENIY